MMISSLQYLTRFCISSLLCNLKKYPQSNAYRYEMSNCLYAAMVENIFYNCSCKPFFLNWDPVSQKVKNASSLPTCQGKQLLCMQVQSEQTNITLHHCIHKTLMNLWGDPSYHLDSVYNQVTGQVEKCYQACELQTETILTSTTSYPSRNVYPAVKAFCVVWTKIRERVCKVGREMVKMMVLDILVSDYS